jgi:ferritin
MLKATIENAINEQIDHEMSSAHLYLSMAAHFEHEKLPGFAAWLKMQSREEFGHGMRLFEYILDRGGRVVLGGIDPPPASFGSAVEVFEQILEHERRVTESIHQLYELALQERDYPTQTHLHWFITEQVEEEKTAEELLDKLKSIEGHMHLLFLLDRELGNRKPDDERDG